MVYNFSCEVSNLVNLRLASNYLRFVLEIIGVVKWNYYPVFFFNVQMAVSLFTMISLSGLFTRGHGFIVACGWETKLEHSLTYSLLKC